MMDTTTSRAEFEKWAEEVGALPWGYLKKQRTPSGGYSIQVYQYMWTAWKAARENIVVERISSADVPSDIVYQLGGSGLSHDEAICEGYSAGFNAAIRSAGLTVKGE